AGNSAAGVSNDLFRKTGAPITDSNEKINASFSIFQTSPTIGAGNTINGTNTSNKFATNPLLSALGNYGGTTQTFALLPGSPAIDAGSNALIPLGITTDQRGTGFPRKVNPPVTPVVDIGAFESSGFQIAMISGDVQTTEGNTPFASPLVVSVTANNAIEPVA